MSLENLRGKPKGTLSSVVGVYMAKTIVFLSIVIKLYSFLNYFLKLNPANYRGCFQSQPFDLPPIEYHILFFLF